MVFIPEHGLVFIVELLFIIDEVGGCIVGVDVENTLAIAESMGKAPRWHNKPLKSSRSIECTSTPPNCLFLINNAFNTTVPLRRIWLFNLNGWVSSNVIKFFLLCAITIILSLDENLS